MGGQLEGDRFAWFVQPIAQRTDLDRAAVVRFRQRHAESTLVVGRNPKLRPWATALDWSPPTGRWTTHRQVTGTRFAMNTQGQRSARQQPSRLVADAARDLELSAVYCQRGFHDARASYPHLLGTQPRRPSEGKSTCDHRERK
jgi:hypothetical protein